MAVKLLFQDMPQYLDGNGAPYSGAKLFTYAAGSSTKQTTYQDSAGSVAHTNPIVLDANGRVPAAVWGTTSQTYKLVLAPAADTDPPASPIFTVDNVTPINDVAAPSLDQWVSGPAPTFVSASQFTLAGDQTSNFHVGRRVKVTDSGGVKYATITASAFGALTTVTVTVDAGGSLATPLSAVSYGLLSYSNHSVPNAHWTTGDVKLTLKTVADSTWVLFDDGTIGNAASGGTTRAHADTEALFTLLWNNTADAQCAVSTGRGATAAADFAANKTIALPKALGRALATYGAGSGLTSRALALATGAETVTLTTGELPSSGLSVPGLSVPSLSVSGSANLVRAGTSGGGVGRVLAIHTDDTDSIGNNTLSDPASNITITGSTGTGTTGTGTTGNMGTGGGHANMQPTLFLNVMVKL